MATKLNGKREERGSWCSTQHFPNWKMLKGVFLGGLPSDFRPNKTAICLGELRSSFPLLKGK